MVYYWVNVLKINTKAHFQVIVIPNGTKKEQTEFVAQTFFLQIRQNTLLTQTLTKQTE